VPIQIQTTWRTFTGWPRFDPHVGATVGAAVVGGVVWVGVACAPACWVGPLRLAMNPNRTATTTATGSTHLHIIPVYVRLVVVEYANCHLADRFVTTCEFC
jgi:hypothetical protein